MSDEEMHERIIENLQQRRAVALISDLDEKSTGELMGRLLDLQRESHDPITLLINSKGGETLPTLHLCDNILYLLRAPVHAVVIGKCSSAATFLLLHCASRVAIPNAQFLIHSGTHSVEIKVDQQLERNMEQMRDELVCIREQVTSLYQKKLNLPKRTVLRLLARGDQNHNAYLSAEEALEIGLIEEIVSEPIGIF